MADRLLRKAEAELKRGTLPFVDAQVAVAVDHLLVHPSAQKTSSS